MPRKKNKSEYSNDDSSDQEQEREKDLLRDDCLEARRIKARQQGKLLAYARQSHEHDMSWQAFSDGPDGEDKYMGPKYNAQGRDFDLERENAFWNKNSVRPTRPVAVQSLGANEKGYNEHTSIFSEQNCQYYWDKASKEMIPIKPTDTLWISPKFNGCTVHGRIIQTHIKKFNSIDPEIGLEPENWDLHLAFWDQHNFYIPIPVHVNGEWTQLGWQLRDQLQHHVNDKYNLRTPLALTKLVFIAELTTAQSADLVYASDWTGRERLGRVNSYKAHVIPRRLYPNCFASVWESDNFRQYDFEHTLGGGSDFISYCNNHYTKNAQTKSPFFWHTKPDGTEIESELTFMLICAQPIGDFKHRAPAPLKVFGTVNGKKIVEENNLKEPFIVKGVKWLEIKPVGRADDIEGLKKRIHRFQTIIQTRCHDFPFTEGFVMSIEENQTDIWYRTGSFGCRWITNWQNVQPGEVAVVKLKPTSSIKGLPYRACNQIGEQNSKHSDVVMRVPWFFQNDPTKTAQHWVRVHTQTDQTRNPKFWQHWEQTSWSKMDPTPQQRWLEENPDKRQDLKDYGAFYFIYSSVHPNAKPEFAIPVGQNFLAGDIYDQLQMQAATGPAAGGAAGGAARDKEEEELPPERLPKVPRRWRGGAWHREDAAGRSDSRPKPTDADNVFDLSRLYPAFYLRMLSTAKAQHQM